MSALWKMVQCSGFLDNLPSLGDLGLGQSLMDLMPNPDSCVSKVLFDAAINATKSQFADTPLLSSNSGNITVIQQSYR